MTFHNKNKIYLPVKHNNRQRNHTRREIDIARNLASVELCWTQWTPRNCPSTAKKSVQMLIGTLPSVTMPPKALFHL
jgi:hypothetical protein